MRLYPHAAAAIGEPALVDLGDGVYVVRFETMKVRSARGALARLLADGTITAQTTVIDSSSGIYALSLALACHEVGVRCRIVGSTTIDPVTASQLRWLGAHLEQMPPTESLALDQDRRVARVREICAREPGTYWMRQYHDPIHDEGYTEVGRDLARLLRARGHRRLALVAAVGSGVSSASIAASAASGGGGMPVRLVGVQPFGSVSFGSAHVPDPEMLIAGIGSAIPFANVRHERYDEIHWISSEVAASGAIALLAEHALFAGLSSGACLAAARHERARRADPVEDAVVLIAPDTGHRYVERVHSRRDVEPLSRWSPTRVTRTEQIALPWSMMDWARRPG